MRCADTKFTMRAGSVLLSAVLLGACGSTGDDPAPTKKADPELGKNAWKGASEIKKRCDLADKRLAQFTASADWQKKDEHDVALQEAGAIGSLLFSHNAVFAEAASEAYREAAGEGPPENGAMNYCQPKIVSGLYASLQKHR